MPQKQPLSECEHLDSLCTSLNRERTTTVKQMAVGNRFGELMHEEKQLISSMLKELTEYEHYLNALLDATFLNKFITMVQSFCQKKTREIYLDLSEVVGQAFCNTLEAFLFKLKGVSLLHERLQGYLNCQSFRSWAVGSAHNKTHKYKPLFRYTFPDCDFDRPLVIRNPNLHVDNATKMFFQLVDIYTKMMRSRAYALSSTELLWLGQLKERSVCTIKSPDCTEQLWLEVSEVTTVVPPTNKPCAKACTSYNAIWFPAFSMFIQFKTNQQQCNKNVFIKWTDTTNCCDANRQQALFDRCNSGEPITVEFYTRAVVDWNLYCPFTMKARFVQHDGVMCPNVAEHTHAHSTFFNVERVREDNLLVLANNSTVRAGNYVTLDFKTSNIRAEQWKEPLDQLLHFYKCVIETQDMQMLQTESQGRQIRSVADCIRKNVAMYQDLIGEYVHINNVQAVNKIRKLNELIRAVEDMLCNAPATVVATSKKDNVQYVIRGKSKYKHTHTKQEQKQKRTTNHRNEVYCETSHCQRVDCDGDISDFSDDDGC